MPDGNGRLESGLIDANHSATFDLQSEPIGPVIITGNDNRLTIGPGSRVHCPIRILASNCLIEIGAGCDLHGDIRIVRGDGSRIIIGDHTNFVGAGISIHESADITIGADCQFADEVCMDVSDMHPIYDRRSGKRINPARSIEIGAHVWIGRRAMVMKGARIGSGCVIGAGSMVLGEIAPNCVAYGSPARIGRRDVAWKRDFDEPAPEPLRRSWPWG